MAPAWERDTEPAVSQENLEIVRALLRAYDRGDYEAALEGLDPEIEWHAPPGVTIGQEVYRGRMEVEKGFAEWQRPWDSYIRVGGDARPRRPRRCLRHAGRPRAR